MAIIGRTRFALRGIRFDEGEEGDEPAESETESNVEESAAAKVEILNAQLAERDATIVALQGEITAAKAANYDLLMQIPGSAPAAPETPADDDETDIDVDDLFGED